MKMKASVFVAKLIDIAKHYKTLYVMGCFGAPLTAANKTRYTQNHSYNKQAARTAMIKAASSDTFGFDCVNLIKGILWGWTGDKNKTYGGASYASNGVPDIGADTMITKCIGVSASGWANMVPGEAVWMPGHIGVYIGDGLAVECSPKWANKVQITAVGNIGKKAGYNTRTWIKHGRLPYIDYVDSDQPQKPTQDNNDNEEDDIMYNTIAECPEYARDTIRRLVDAGCISGTGTGKKDADGRPADLALNETMVRMLVILDRADAI